MKEIKMARKCTIQGCGGQYIEVFYADAEHITLFYTGESSYKDGGIVVLSTAQYPSFSVLTSAQYTVRGIEESEFGKCRLKRLMLADDNEYFVRKDGTVIKLVRDGSYALTVEQFTPAEFAEIVQGVAFDLCKA